MNELIEALKTLTNIASKYQKELAFELDIKITCSEKCFEKIKDSLETPESKEYKAELLKAILAGKPISYKGSDSNYNGLELNRLSIIHERIMDKKQEFLNNHKKVEE